VRKKIFAQSQNGWLIGSHSSYTYCKENKSSLYNKAELRAVSCPNGKKGLNNECYYSEENHICSILI
jgi:hypothetical protein